MRTFSWVLSHGTRSCLQGATKLAAALSEALSCAAAAVQLRPPDAKAMAATEGRLDAKAFAKLAADRELVAQFTAVLEEWCSTVQELLDMGLGAGPELDGAGASAIELQLPSSQGGGIYLLQLWLWSSIFAYFCLERCRAGGGGGALAHTHDPAQLGDRAAAGLCLKRGVYCALVLLVCAFAQLCS